jgi:hypothetical protein
MCECTDRQFSKGLPRGPFDSPPHLAQVLRNQFEVRQRRGWNWLLVLPGNFK